MEQNLELNNLEKLSQNVNLEEKQEHFAKISNSLINLINLKESELNNFLENHKKYKNDLVHLVDEHDKQVEKLIQKINWKNPLKIFQNIHNEYLKYSEMKSFKKNKAEIDSRFFQENKDFIANATESFSKILNNAKELKADAQLEKLIKQVTKKLFFLKENSPENATLISTKQARNLSDIKKYVANKFKSFEIVDNDGVMSVDRNAEMKILNDIKTIAITLPNAKTEDVTRNIVAYKTLLTASFDDANATKTIEQAIEILEKAAKQHKKIDRALLNSTTQNMPDFNQLLSPLLDAKLKLTEMSNNRLDEITPKTHKVRLNYGRNLERCSIESGI